MLFIISFLLLFISCSSNPVIEPAQPESNKIEYDYELDELDAKIANSVPGAVIIYIKNGEITGQNAYGYRDYESRERMKIDSVFRVASISKSITALGIMKLFENGQISLDDPVQKYLSGWRIPKSEFQSQGVTFRRLLNHTAGIIDHTIEFYYRENPETPSWEQIIEEGSKLKFLPLIVSRRPGTYFAFSNHGYVNLQLLTEEISGMRFRDYMQKNVLEPMKMQNSSFRYSPEMEGLFARPHTGINHKVENYIDPAPAASGGLHTTAQDLATLIIEMMKCYNGEENIFLLKRDTLLLMLSDCVPTKTGSKNQEYYGLGFFMNELGNGIKTYGHNGSSSGIRTQFEFCPDTKDGLIILTNGDKGRVELIDPVLKEWRENLKGR
jgi:CubicO group peptidase (beta-lactamase class C family)